MSTITVTHHGSSPRIDRPMKAKPVSTLSAMGSSSLPRSVTISYLRASQPSIPSVAMATMNRAAAHQRSAPSAPPSASSIHRKIGAHRMRTIVMRFGSWRGIAISVPSGKPPGILIAFALDDRIALVLRLYGVGDVAVSGVGRIPCGGRIPAPQLRQHAGQLLDGDQDIASLGSLGGADDLARFEEVHQPAGLREADAELALQHRGRAELSRHDELGRGEQELEVVADIGIHVLLLRDDGDVVAVVG